MSQDAPPELLDPSQHSIHVVHLEGEMREAVPIERPRKLAFSGAARRGEVQELDHRTVPFHVDGAQLHVIESQERIGGLARDFERVSVAEAEGFLVEALRTRGVRNAEPDVGEAQRSFP
jgi:hypothetical protein